MGLSLDPNDSFSMKILRAKEGEREKTGETSSLSHSHAPLLFVTSLSRFALTSAKNEKTKCLAAFGGYLEKPLEKKSLFAGWNKSYTRFLCFPGCPLTRAWSVVSNVHFKLCYEGVLPLSMDHCSPQFLISFHLSPDDSFLCVAMENGKKG